MRLQEAHPSVTSAMSSIDLCQPKKAIWNCLWRELECFTEIWLISWLCPSFTMPSTEQATERYINCSSLYLFHSTHCKTGTTMILLRFACKLKWSLINPITRWMTTTYQAEIVSESCLVVSQDVIITHQYRKATVVNTVAWWWDALISDQGSIPEGCTVDWDSQSLYTAAIWRTETGDWEQNKQKKWAWNSRTTEHAHLCLFCPTRFWLARFKVQRETRSSHRTVYRASFRNTLYCAAWIPTHWSVVERDSAHVYYRAHF